MARPGKSYRKGRLSTVDLLVLVSLNQLLSILKVLFTFFTKQPALMRRSIVQSLPPWLVFPGSSYDAPSPSNEINHGQILAYRTSLGPSFQL